MTATQQYDQNEREPLAAPATIEGWWRPPGANKRHYFIKFDSAGFTTLYDSLCGAYSTGYGGSKSFKPGPDESPSNCLKCQRKRQKLKK